MAGPRNAVSAPAPASLASVGRTYRVLGSTTTTYLGHDECKRFLKLTPDLYSRENLRRFEKRIDELKAAAREVVRPLMGSGLELEVEFQGAAAAAQESAMLNRRSILAGAGAGPGGGGGGGGTVVGASLTNYLTCVHVYDRDLPWDVDVD